MSSSQNRFPQAPRNHPSGPDATPERDANTTPHPPTVKPKALIVASSTEQQTPHLKHFTNILEQAGVALIRRTAPPDRLDHLIRSVQDEVAYVVLTGAGGRLGPAAVTLRDTGLPVGILPAPDNTLARSLNIPSDPAAAAQVILAGHKHALDLATVNGHPFFGVASVGLTVQDARQLGRAARHPAARLAFACQAARLNLRTGRFAAIIRCGSTIHRVHTVQITIGNGHAYTGNMDPGTEQPGNNGMLTLYSLEPATKWGLLFLRHAFQARENQIVAEARHAQAPVVEIVTRLPRPITADGAVLTITPARFTIHPRAIHVFAPAPSPPGRIA